MRRRRFDGARRRRKRRRGRPFQGPRRNGVIGERSALMCDPHRPIQMLFHYDLRGVDRRLDLIQLAVVGHGPISPHDRVVFTHKIRAGRCRLAVCAGGTAKLRW